MIVDPLTPAQQRARLATAVRNACTHQCVFTPWPGLEFAFRDGALHQVTANAAYDRRAYGPALLRVEELIGMDDDEIWVRVMGASE
jgi:hypothetical protein